MQVNANIVAKKLALFAIRKSTKTKEKQLRNNSSFEVRGNEKLNVWMRKNFSKAPITKESN